MHEKKYRAVEKILRSKFEEVGCYDFYNYIFPENQEQGNQTGYYKKPNAIFLYRDEKDAGTKRSLRARIMLKDILEEDCEKYIKNNSLTLCSGLSYRGRFNRLENAQNMNALAFDLDGVGEDELLTLFLRIGKEPGLRTLPQPTFIVMSGSGLHLYYVFEEPISLYPNIKLQLKNLKYDLTFKMWEYGATSTEKQIQYQSINQGFRMVGSINEKYGLKLIAFKTGERVSLEYVNQYVDDPKNKVDINRPFSPSQYTKQEAEEKFPEWYQRVVVKGDKKAKKWKIKRDLYDWWLRQSNRVKGGHRYFYLMCMAIYGVKCDIPKDEVKEDMYKLFEELSKIKHSNKLEERDILSALETYDRQYYNFKIDDIIKLTDIHIEKNKRNYRKQKDHIKLMNYVRDEINKNTTWNKEGNGRPEGSGTKEDLVKNYINENPNANPTEVAMALKISRTTVYKYKKELEKESPIVP